MPIKTPKPLKELNLMDRFLFAQAMDDPEIMRDTLQIILNRPIELAGNPQTEKEKRRFPWSKYIRLDVWAVDEEGTAYDTEVQGENTCNLPKRSRYYQGLMDSQMLPTGEIDYNKLNQVYIIIIAPFDLFGQGRYQYTFSMRCSEDPGLSLKDGAVRIFLNTKGKNPEEVRPELVEFLNYMEHTDEQTARDCTNSAIREMQKRIEAIKGSEEIGVKYMQEWEERTIEVQKAKEEGHASGLAEGHASGLAEGHASGLAEGLLEGLAVLVRVLKREMPDFESLCARIRENQEYAQVSDEEIKRYYDAEF
jgi:predicted transposase/invertase (TIGR01784 family)